MTLHSGAQVMHHGRAIELLYRHGRVGTTANMEMQTPFR